MSTGKGSSGSSSKVSSNSNTGKSPSSPSSPKSTNNNKYSDTPNTPPPPYTPISNSNVPNTPPPPYTPNDKNKSSPPSTSDSWIPPYNPGSSSNSPIASGSNSSSETSRTYIPAGDSYNNNYNGGPINSTNNNSGLSLGGKIAIGVVFGLLGLGILIFIAYYLYKRYLKTKVRDIETTSNTEYMEQRSLPLNSGCTTILNSEDCRDEAAYMEQNLVNSPLLYNSKL